MPKKISTCILVISILFVLSISASADVLYSGILFDKVKVFIWNYDMSKMMPMALSV